MVKVLLAVTSYHGKFYADGAKTGLFAVEAIHPFEYFRSQGADVTFVSETGTFGYDEHSLSEDFLNGDARNIYQDEHSEYNIAIKNIKKASDLDADDYDIFFAAGGHGTLFDFPNADGLHKLAGELYAKGGVVSAVCHGPIIFDNLINPHTGKPLIQGKKVTAFTDVGESMMGLDDILSTRKLDTCSAMVKRMGGIYDEPAEPWADYSIADGKLVSGVNPASATSTAAKALQASKLG